jgi:hypothetical protein
VAALAFDTGDEANATGVMLVLLRIQAMLMRLIPSLRLLKII